MFTQDYYLQDQKPLEDALHSAYLFPCDDFCLTLVWPLSQLIEPVPAVKCILQSMEMKGNAHV